MNRLTKKKPVKSYQLFSFVPPYNVPLSTARSSFLISWTSVSCIKYDFTVTDCYGNEVIPLCDLDLITLYDRSSFTRSNYFLLLSQMTFYHSYSLTLLFPKSLLEKGKKSNKSYVKVILNGVVRFLQCGSNGTKISVKLQRYTPCSHLYSSMVPVRSSSDWT